MPEEKNDQQSADAVKREDYNKVVESHNSLKAENEEMKRKLDEIASKMKVNEERELWKKEADELKKSIEEIKKQAEEKKDTTKVAKGIVPTNQTSSEALTPESFKSLINTHIPERPKIPERFGSKIQSYGYYKNGTTRTYNNTQLGMVLSLHAAALAQNPHLVPAGARPMREDIILRQ